MIKEVANKLENVNSCYTNILPKAIGQVAHKEKRWVIDVDDIAKEHAIWKLIEQEPPAFEKNILVRVPTVNGVHFICTPFNPTRLYSYCGKDVVRKNNPTLLYYNDANK